MSVSKLIYLYRLVTYFTVAGLVKHIHLGDFVYGKWIVYDSNQPKYYIDAFNKDTTSNRIIFEVLLNNKKETIESIICKINQNHGLKLSLDNRPFIRVRFKSEPVNLNLPPLPDYFVKNI